MNEEENSIKILTEVSKAPLRAVALASYLGEGYSTLGRTPPVKDLMAFGSVLQHTQHNIGTYTYDKKKTKEDLFFFSS